MRHRSPLSLVGRVAVLCGALALLGACGAAAPPGERPPPAPRAPPRVHDQAGAELHLDGIFVGSAPLAEPVSLDRGPHDVVVTLTGHEPFARRVMLEGGRASRVEVDLDETVQRKVAWGFIGGGGALLPGGIVFGVLSVIEHRASRDILSSASGGSFGEEDKRLYDETIARRDDYRVGSGVLGGAALLSFGVGAILFGFDDPPKPRDVSVSTSLSDHEAGASVEVRF